MLLTELFPIADWKDKSVSESKSNGRTGCMSCRGPGKICKCHSEQSPHVSLSETVHLIAVVCHRTSKGCERCNLCESFRTVCSVLLCNQLNIITVCIFLCCEFNVGQLARHQYECMRREAASLKIQKDFLMHISRKAYKNIYDSAIYIQIGLRGMVARNDLRFRKRSHAAAVIQVG